MDGQLDTVPSTQGKQRSLPHSRCWPRPPAQRLLTRQRWAQMSRYQQSYLRWSPFEGLPKISLGHGHHARASAVGVRNRTRSTLPEGGKPLTLSHGSISNFGLGQRSAFSAIAQAPGAAESTRHPPAQYLTEEGSVEGDSVEAINCPHGDVQVHQ